MPDNLKPCPFCGGRAALRKTSSDLEEGWWGLHVECFDCGARSGRAISHSDDIGGMRAVPEHKWNARTSTERESGFDFAAIKYKLDEAKNYTKDSTVRAYINDALSLLSKIEGEKS